MDCVLKSDSMPDPVETQADVYEIDLDSLPVIVNGRLQYDGRPLEADQSKELAKSQTDREARNEMLARYGISPELVLTRHRENLDAVTYMAIGQGEKRRIVAVPDFKTRQKACDQGEKLLALLPTDEKGDSGRPVVLVLSDAIRRKAEGLKGSPLDIVDVTSEPQTSDETETVYERLGIAGPGGGDEYGSPIRREEDSEGAPLAGQADDAGRPRKSGRRAATSRRSRSGDEQRVSGDSGTPEAVRGDAGGGGVFDFE